MHMSFFEELLGGPEKFKFLINYMKTFSKFSILYHKQNILKEIKNYEVDDHRNNIS